MGKVQISRNVCKGIRIHLGLEGQLFDRGTRMKHLTLLLAAALLSTAATAKDPPHFSNVERNALEQVREGRDTFRYSTFGDEAFWGDGIGLHLALAGADNGGVGPGVSPATALAVGLKVDVDALPWQLQKAIARGKVDLDDPKTTLQ